MTKATIYHNPRCSKSRQTLQLLQERGITPEVVHYLDTPPDRKRLKQLLAQLRMTPRQLLRRSEQAYKDRGLDDPALRDEALIEAMVEEPILIERPIVVMAGRAALGRPPENVLDLLE